LGGWEDWENLLTTCVGGSVALIIEFQTYYCQS